MRLSPKPVSRSTAPFSWHDNWLSSCSRLGKVLCIAPFVLWPSASVFCLCCCFVTVLTRHSQKSCCWWAFKRFNGGTQSQTEYSVQWLSFELSAQSALSLSLSPFHSVSDSVSFKDLTRNIKRLNDFYSVWNWVLSLTQFDSVYDSVWKLSTQFMNWALSLTQASPLLSQPWD